ncbi:peptide/nickel transport system ATP-binding protein [Friedmanniella endophytica]|uniref:Peptide/nickel transport system ATP-binding protein n=1 Tax=Microlunatus kandeliicorticis TaxID=1759536 RepID=A0A7W3IVE0_9ACTN|nr:ABC transporter ATP-binding protein [Microlunatus kandeliicorticis]MBA8795966.1 peptide/nickel transport system ATP-binding protein [Microlunatus kandeliicorticis]
MSTVHDRSDDSDHPVSDPVLEVRDLAITFASDAGPVRAVDGVSLSVGRGEVLAVVGESGSGKTVTAKSVLGLLPQTATSSGVIMLSGRDGGRADDVVRVSRNRLRQLRGTDAAMVFQEPSTALNPVFTVGWQIAEGLRAHASGRLSRSEARARAVDILGRVGIPDPHRRVDHYPHQFSGGQKQRIVIAMALVLDPGLIIADEPTTALDVTVQAEILDLLRRCRDEFGASILLITHNLGVVADLADRVAVMYQGRVVEQADAVTLFAHPQEEYTQRLLAAVPSVGQGGERARVRAGERAERAERAAAAGETTPSGPVISATDLRIQYPGRLGRPGFLAVDGVSFTVGPGEVLGLVGESGSGKTTIARAVAGLTAVTGGSLRVLGTELNGARERALRPHRRDLGFVFQDPASSFNPQLTIAEAVAEPLIIHGGGRHLAAARARVDEMLEAVQLPASYGDRFPHELSGGQRQRASLARALVLRPRLLIADEPTSALDVSVQARVLELFTELQRELGFAALFISHDLAVVDLLSDRIAVLHRGRLVEEGTGEQILGAPEHPYTRRLLASLPVPDPQLQAQRRAEFRALSD